VATWRRLDEYSYEHVPSGKVVEREAHGGNGHFSIWTIRGERGRHPTRRDAQRFIERTIAPRTEVETAAKP
jgi:hypothetical protein